MKWRALKAAWTVVDLLRSPAYAVPLVVNLTGSVWFFLLIGKAGEFGEVFVRWISFLRGGGVVLWSGPRGRASDEED